MEQEPSLKKKAFFDPACAFAVYELPPGWVPSWDETERLIAKFEAEFGLKVALVPHGGSIKVLPNGGVYHRERLGEYEIEIVARTEEGVRARVALCCHGPGEKK